MPQTNNPFSPGTQLHDVAETLLSRPTPPLVPKEPWSAEITHLVNQASVSEKATPFVTAALHLLNDDLDRAHQLVQAQEGDQTADYLHMLVHRREGDWSNTGYWVRRTGEHPVYAALAAMVKAEPDEFDSISRGNQWDPNAMVEMCRQADRGKPDARTAGAIADLSARELRIALDWCVRNSP